MHGLATTKVGDLDVMLLFPPNLISWKSLALNDSLWQHLHFNGVMHFETIRLADLPWQKRTLQRLCEFSTSTGEIKPSKTLLLLRSTAGNKVFKNKLCSATLDCGVEEWDVVKVCDVSM